MNLKIIDLFRLIKPESKTDKTKYDNISNYLSKENLKTLTKLIKLKKAGISYSTLGVSKNILQDCDYPSIHINIDKKDAKENKEITGFVEKVNQEIRSRVMLEFYKKFSLIADRVIPNLISPNLTGFDTVKQAAAIQLFSKEKAHILLIGDPGTGKTDILRSISKLAPVSSFGLGSGTSNAGLSMTINGDEIVKGLLPMADLGICCIDELNLMKKEDMASLYSAMEKGFITYDKAKKHITLDARINILATANPKGDKFVGWMINTLKKQIPFESALLSRFHLIFLVRRPDIKQFEAIAKKIVSDIKAKSNENDYKFVKDYIASLDDFDVTFPKNLEKNVIDFSKELKLHEKEYITEISPRIVHGIIRFAKASAKMNMRQQVNLSDLAKVKHIFEESLIIKQK